MHFKPEAFHMYDNKEQNKESLSFEVKDKILECFMYISVVGLGVTAAEKFGKK